MCGRRLSFIVQRVRVGWELVSDSVWMAADVILSHWMMRVRFGCTGGQPWMVCGPPAESGARVHCSALDKPGRECCTAHH